MSGKLHLFKLFSFVCEFLSLNVCECVSASVCECVCLFVCLFVCMSASPCVGLNACVSPRVFNLVSAPVRVNAIVYLPAGVSVRGVGVRLYVFVCEFLTVYLSLNGFFPRCWSLHVCVSFSLFMPAPECVSVYVGVYLFFSELSCLRICMFMCLYVYTYM